MNEPLIAVHEVPGPPPPPPPGPIAQSVAIGFRTVYLAALLLALLWFLSNVREIASDSQAVVRRFGRIVRTQEAGLLLALPRPIETVQLLPGPERQLSHDVAALPSASEKSTAAIGTSAGAQSLPVNAAPFLTGDGNVVLLNSTLIYRISDPAAYALAETHVSPALDRLFRATIVRVTAGRNLNDFLVVQSGEQTGANAATGGNAGVVALRSEVRNSLLQQMNDRLTQLAAEGTALGVEIQRIDMTAWLPPEARSAFDAVLVATQAADRGVAVARTEAERRRQEAERQSAQLVAGAQATATELVSSANVNTAGILALEKEETPETRGSLLMREYRSNVANIINRVGSVTLIDPAGGVRFVLPGNQK
jgi:regulator of protease activity HflC (stomatin/prohibitin superfamily)